MRLRVCRSQMSHRPGQVGSQVTAASANRPWPPDASPLPLLHLKFPAAFGRLLCCRFDPRAVKFSEGFHGFQRWLRQRVRSWFYSVFAHLRQQPLRSNLAQQPLQPEPSVIQHGRRKQIPAVRLRGGAEPAGGESFAFPKSSRGEIAPKITL